MKLDTNSYISFEEIIIDPLIWVDQTKISFFERRKMLMRKYDEIVYSDIEIDRYEKHGSV